MKSVDPLLTRHYNPENYHCVHFLIDAALYLFDQNYSGSFIGLTSALHETLRTSRNTVIKNKRITKPTDGTIVLMTNVKQSSHVGLFYCGKILHLTEMGVHFLPVSTVSIFYKRIRYYEPSTHSKKSA